MKQNIMKGYIMFYNRNSELSTLKREYQKRGSAFTVIFVTIFGMARNEYYNA